MGASIVAIIFTSFASAVGYLAAPKNRAFKVWPIAAYWVVSAVVVFLVPEKLFVFSILTVALAVLAPTKPIPRVCFYLGVLWALPDFVVADVPFPALNYLIELDHTKIASIVILGPLLYTALKTRPPEMLRHVETILILYALYTALVAIREFTLTHVARMLLDQFIVIVIPFIVISRVIRTQEDIIEALKAFLTGLIIVAMVGAISVARSWNYYAGLNPNPFSFLAYVDTRNGILRTSSTLMSTLLGFVAGFGAATMFYLRSIRQYSFWLTIILIALFAVVSFATGSRGGWLSAFIVVGAFAVLPRLPKLGYWAVLVGIPSVAILAGALIVTGAVTVEDEYGTFEYRAELLRTSIVQILDYPFFGMSFFAIQESPRFESLIQGQGIVDLVNVYVQVALLYGLIGLGLFLAAHMMPLYSGLMALKRTVGSRKERSQALETARNGVALLVAMHIGFTFMIATTSLVSYIPQFEFLILALLTVQVRAIAEIEAPSTPKPAPAAKAELAEDERPQARARDERKPYGARFVRRH